MIVLMDDDSDITIMFLSFEVWNPKTIAKLYNTCISFHAKWLHDYTGKFKFINFYKIYFWLTYNRESFTKSLVHESDHFWPWTVFMSTEVAHHINNYWYYINISYGLVGLLVFSIRCSRSRPSSIPLSQGLARLLEYHQTFLFYVNRKLKLCWSSY